MKISKKKNALNQRIFHKMQSHLAFQHIKMCKLIRHTICESLVKLQQFKHEWLYGNTKKPNKIKRLSITCNYI